MQRLPVPLKSFVGTTLLALLLLSASSAYAHVSEQGFVLLLPTHIYIASGVLTVLVTILLISFVPASLTEKLFISNPLFSKHKNSLGPKSSKNNIAITEAGQTNPARLIVRNLPSLISFAALVFLLTIGVTGTHDPLENALPLFIWTVWWIGFVVVQGVFGNWWKHLNPWTGLYRLLTTILNAEPRLSAHKHLGVWPAIVGLLLFSSFALANPAPDAPVQLALVVGSYFLITLLLMFVFGERWLEHGECFTILLQRYSQLAVIGVFETRRRAGFFGWRAIAQRATTISGAIFILILLGSGSFDGLNETFRWLAFIGVNPLEFPGRSSVISETIIGLAATNGLLIACYAACIALGTAWANRQNDAGNTIGFKDAFSQLAIALLPIAFVYHFAHFLTSFMVNIQYAVATASDPLNTGADLLNLGTFYVTTGFMNSHHTVEIIWLTQAFTVVLGHVLSVLMAHSIALNLFASPRRAIISQVPLASFMVLYTFIGLWLLAAPKGA